MRLYTSAKDIFLDALELPDDRRPAFVESACKQDAELMLRVLALLEAHRRFEALQERDAPPIPADSQPALEELKPGARIGGYRLVEEIGEGGFGVVWAADQEEPLRRRVALKVLKAGMDTREVVKRFEAERQALALMDHPSIARIFDAGATPSGRPFFAMELVDGRPITDYCSERALSIWDRLRLFAAVCKAVQHAHQKGIVHRDIKPTNVLVAEEGGEPIPKVIDFGIAKAIDQRLTEETMRTRAGALVGTPAYMSPEQAVGGEDIDTRTDVYSLGALLYEVLSGGPPFDQETLGSADIAAIQRIVREVEPQRPSTRLLNEARRAEQRRGEARSLARRVRGDLDWITMRCLEKDRERRYQSAIALADEIERFLNGEPVLAGPPSLVYRTSRFVRRHRALVGAAALVLIAVIGGATASAVQAVRARDAEREARRELERFEAISSFLQSILVGIDPAVAQGKDRELLLQVLEEARQRIEDDPFEHPDVEATLVHTIGGAYMAIASYDLAEELFRRAVALREEHLGAGDPETLYALSDLGGLLLQLGRYDEAEEPLVAAHEGRRLVLGEEHTDTLKTLGNIGVLRRKQGRFEEAEEILVKVEEARTRLLGEEDVDTVYVLNNLGGLYDDIGREEEAHRRYERCYEILLRTQGDEHPLTLRALHNLASVLLDLERWEEGTEMLERSIELKRRILGPEDPSVLIGMNNLAYVYKDRGDLENAEKVFRDALDIGRSTLDENHEIVLSLTYSLGTALVGRDDEQALELYRAALEGFVAGGGETHVRAPACHHAMAGALHRLERLEEAEGHARRAVASARGIFSAGHEAVGVYLTRLGEILVARGSLGEAETVLVEAFDVLEDTNVEPWRQQAADALNALRTD